MLANVTAFIVLFLFGLFIFFPLVTAILRLLVAIFFIPAIVVALAVGVFYLYRFLFTN